MSNRYEASHGTSAAPAANGAYMEIRAGARRMLVEEIGFFIGAATATRVTLARATSVGTGGNPVTGQAEDPNAPTALGAVAANTFTSAPVLGASTTWMRRVHLPAAIGSGIIWTWPSTDRLIVPASGSVLLAAMAAGSAASDFYAVWTE